MKTNQLLIMLVVVTSLMACGKKGHDLNTLVGKNARLTELKDQMIAAKTEIETLEKEVAVLDPKVRQDKVTNVTIEPVALVPFTHSIDLQGAVRADQEMMITPKGMGTITKILIQNGDRVSAGQVVAYLDDAMMQKGMSEIQQQLDFARTAYTKQKNLWDQGIGSEMQFLQAKNGVESLEKRMATMSEQNGSNIVRAPISGVIDEVYAKVGGATAPGAPIAKLINFTKLKVQAEVAEAYAGKVRQGNTVQLNFPDLNKNVNATIKYIGNAINPINRSFKIEMPIAGGQNGIIPNMVAIVKIIDYQKAKAVVIPVTMVQKGANGDFVLIAVDDNGKKVTKRALVTLGQNYDGKVEILSGLKGGEALIMTGYQDLNEGDGVKY
jgi:RND family efflux transporter MFP subunit